MVVSWPFKQDKSASQTRSTSHDHGFQSHFSCSPHYAFDSHAQLSTDYSIKQARDRPERRPTNVGIAFDLSSILSL